MQPSQKPQVKSHSLDIQEILDRHAKVFGEILHRLSPDRGIEHVIELEESQTNYD